MDKKALYSLSYGVFMLGVKSGTKTNGCITNTCIQVANSPVRVAFSVLNTNYTCDLLKESGVCTLSILDKTIPFQTIKYFGMQSGRDVDKMSELPLPVDDNGVPYLNWGASAVLSLKVTDSQDLGSHTLFIAEVTDAKKLSDNEPLTYAFYQSDIKPKADSAADKPVQKKIIGWRCRICNYVYEGETLPEEFYCPLCGHDASDFEPIYE